MLTATQEISVYRNTLSPGQLEHQLYIFFRLHSALMLMQKCTYGSTCNTISSLSPALHHEVVDWSGAAGGRGLTVLTSHQCYHLGNEHYTVMKEQIHASRLYCSSLWDWPDHGRACILEPRSHRAPCRNSTHHWH